MMGLINKLTSHAIKGRQCEREIAEAMYHEQRMKRDYYGTPTCPRGFGGAKEKCASCTLAPVCKTGSRSW